MHYFLGGINGVGKSSLLAEINKIKPEYLIINHSKEFMKWLGIGDDYDRLRKKDPNSLSKLDSEFVNSLISKNSQKTLILNSHYTLLIKGKIFKPSCPWMAKFDVLILITAPAKEILKRINKDLSQRDRALFSPEISNEERLKLIRKYAELEKTEFVNLATKLKKPHLIIVNQEDKIQEAVNNFLEFDRKTN